MTRIAPLPVVAALWLLPALAQPPQPVQSKLSPRLQMLVSGDPALNNAARRILQIKTGPQRPRETIGAFLTFTGDPDALRATLALYGAALRTVVGKLATAEIPVQTLEQVASLPNIVKIDESHELRPNLDVSVPATGANILWYGGAGPVAANSTTRGAMPPPWSGNTGKQALVGVVDTGIDLNHKDFIDPFGNTRILWVWDQLATRGTPPTAPAGYPAFTGNECSAAQIDALHQKTDLAVTESFEQDMLVSKRSGGGSFAPQTNFQKGHSSVASVAADFNRDGKMDLVTANLDGTISWVPGNGNYGFSPQAPITVGPANVQITFVTSGDFNHDGFPDVAAVLYQSGQIGVLLGNGDGTFQAPTLIGVGSEPTAIGVGDLNGDGNADLVVSNYGDGNIAVLLGDGKGNFTAAAGSPFPVSNIDPNSSTGVHPSYLTLGDFNGDGKLDVATSDFSRTLSGLPAADLSILLGNGDGSFSAATTYTTGRFGLVVAAGDLDGDGVLDLVLQSYSTAVTVYLGNGDGTFANGVAYPAGGNTGFFTGTTSLLIGDFDGDGFPDVANLINGNGGPGGGSFYNQLAVYLGNGDGTLGPAVYSSITNTGNASSLTLGNFHSTVCTELDLAGHGTNVASIAAGNGSAGGPGALQTPYRYIGMAPEAGIVFVRSDFYDVDAVDAVAYIESKASALGLPVAINLSFETDTGPHDGTANVDTMLSGLAGPGQIVVAAMGNSQSANRHVTGAVAAGQTLPETFSVPANVMGNAVLDLWYAGQDRFGVTLTGPSGTCTPNVVYPVNTIVLSTLACGTVTVYAYAVNTNDGDNEIEIVLNNGSNPIPSGNWSVNVIGAGCASGPCTFRGSYDIWASPACNPQGFCLVFTGPNLTPLDTIGSPGSALNAISVGSYVTKTSFTSWNTALSPFTDTYGQVGSLSSFSALGPLRGCSSVVCLAPPIKPDIVAPGEEIMGAYAANTTTAICSRTPGVCLDPDAQHVVYQGTSQAAPHVTGAVALMLSQNPNLSPCQVKASLSHARTDNFTQAVPNVYYGSGKLAVDQAIGVTPVNNPVPNVAGLTQAAATAALYSAGLLVGAVTLDGSTTVAAGRVIGTSPAAGTPWCGQVSLVISTGLTSIAVTPANPSVLAGLKQQFVATGTFQDNTTQDLTSQVTWGSATVATATVDATGLATTLAVGATTITATFGSISGSAVLTAASPGRCDVSGDGILTSTDIVALVAQSLGLAPPTGDLNRDGVINAADIQIVAQALRGNGCSAQ